MAAKAEATPNVPAAPANTAVADWQKELAGLTVATQEAEKPRGNFVSFQGGTLSIGGNRMKDDKVKAIVLHSIFENQWYKYKYDPNNPTTPSCFAFAETKDEEEVMKPHPDSAEPQSPTCAECPKNKWKSDPDGGKGKWCKNIRRLGIMSSEDLDKIDKAEVALAKLPVTSGENWAVYASQISNVLKLPPLAVVTEISVVRDPKTQYKINFGLVEKVKDEFLPALLGKRRDSHALILAPYDKPTEPTPAGSSEPKKYA